MGRYGATLTVASGKITGTVNNLSWLLTAACFPPAAIDGGATSILNGGGNLRAYTDSTKATRLPLEIVTFVTGGTPEIQVWGLSDLAVGSTIYIEADTVETSQPAVTNAYGRNSVWVDFEYRCHFEALSELADSTGNYSLSKSGVISQVSGVVGDASDSAGSLANAYSISGYAGPLGASARTHSGWIKSTSASAGVINYGASVSAGRYTIRTDGGAVRHEVQGSFAKTTATNFNDGVFHSFALKTDGTASWPDNQKISVDGIDQPVTVGGVIDLNTVSSGDLEFSGRTFGAEIYDEFGLRLFATSAEMDLAEYSNQSDPASFFTVGAWEDQDAGGGLLLPSGIVTQEAFSTPEVINLNQVLGVSSVFSQEAFGTSAVINTQVLRPTSVSSLEALGSPVIITGATTLEPSGIVSEEASGAPSLIYAQVVSVLSILGEEVFGLAIVRDGVGVIIPVTNRRTYQEVQTYLKSTGRFVSKDNNGILLEWLRSEGVDASQINDAFFKYWESQGYTGAFNDKWKKWREEGTS